MSRDNAEYDKYGYADPDTAAKYGYGDDNYHSRSSRATEGASKYGYGDAEPDYGYGDAAPDSAAKYEYGEAAPEPSRYGYEDGAPDSSNYGYGDGAPDSAATDYGYGDGAPDSATKYGYGDATPDSAAAGNDYGYGDAAPDSNEGYQEYRSGYNDDGGTAVKGRRLPRRTKSGESVMSVDSHHSVATAESYGSYEGEEGGSRKQRYRRRGSVTRYSIVAQNAVVEEFQQHANIIDQFRAGNVDPSTNDAMQPLPAGEVAPPPQDQQEHRHHAVKKSDDGGESHTDNHSDDGMGAVAKKKKGRGRLAKGIKSMRRRFSLGI